MRSGPGNELGFGPSVVASLLLTSGCYFQQVQHAEESDIQRIEQKQAVLQAQQQASTKLEQQEEQLIAELSQREVSLTELNEQVQHINRENGRSIGDNASTREHYLNLLTQLHETNTELTLVQEGDAAAVESRRQQIAALKARLKSQVDLLLH